MQTLPRTLILSSGFLGLCMIVNGLYALGQTSLDVRADNGWRRTSIGWEHADSLPVASKTSAERTELVFPRLNVPISTIEYVHRLAIPLAISGFMACLGPWLLLRWPTNPIEIR
jgi:hypothetical protein